MFCTFMKTRSFPASVSTAGDAGFSRFWTDGNMSTKTPWCQKDISFIQWCRQPIWPFSERRFNLILRWFVPVWTHLLETGFDPSVCRSVELPGAPCCFRVLTGFGALLSTNGSFDSFFFFKYIVFGALGSGVMASQYAAQKWLECDFCCFWLYFYFFWM